MKKHCSLPLSIARNNKGFTFGLIMLFVILASSIVMVCYITSSVRGTIDDYIEEYHAPDLWVVTDVIPESVAEQLPEYPEIVGREYSMIMNVRCRVDKKQVFSLALSGIEEDGFRKYYKAEEKHTQTNMPEIMVSSYYANTNNIKAGDILELMTDKGYKEFFVSTIASCPENMLCNRDETSWCDSSDYGYLYLSREVMNQYFPVEGFANHWSFLTSDDCSGEKEEEILEKITETFGDHVISSDRFADSNIKTQLESELDQMDKAIRYMPYFLYLLGLCFTSLFIQQIMRNQRKMIGLLLALGCSRRQVLMIFINYTVMTNIIGIILGTGLGSYLTKYSVGIYRNTYSLPYVHLSADMPFLITLLIIPLFIGVLSCVIRSTIISKTDPADAYSDSAPRENRELPQWLKDLKLPEMIKLAILSIYRNRRRFFLSIVCIAATMVISLTSIAISISNSTALSMIFGNDDNTGGRLRYDALIHNTGGDGFLQLVRDTDGVSMAEPVIVFKADIRAGEKELNTKFNAITENSTLLVPQNAGGEVCRPGAGIVLEEITARELGVKVGDTVKAGNIDLIVTEIAREAVNATQYISFDTAEKLGYCSWNEIAVSYAENADPYKVGDELSQLPGFSYFLVREHQKLAVVNACNAKNIAVYMCCILALVLGFIIVFNMVALDIEDRKLDYVTLVALGTSIKDFFKMAFTESVIRYLFAVALGLPAGYRVALAVMNGMSSTKTSYPFVQPGKVFLITVLMSLAYFIGGLCFQLWKVRTMDTAAALNARG